MDLMHLQIPEPEESRIDERSASEEEGSGREEGGDEGDSIRVPGKKERVIAVSERLCS